MRCAVFAFPLQALAACGGGGGDGDPGDRRPSGLVSAAARGDVGEGVRRLLADGAPVSTRAIATGAPPSRRPRWATMSMSCALLIDAGADVDLQDAERNNPLLVCGVTGNVAMLREVLRADPDVRLHQPLRRDRPDPGQRARARRDGARPAADRHRRRPRQPARMDGAARGGHPRRRRPRAPADRASCSSTPAPIVGLADRDGVTALEHARERGYDEIALHARGRGRRGRVMIAAILDERHVGGIVGAAVEGVAGRDQ